MVLVVFLLELGLFSLFRNVLEVGSHDGLARGLVFAGVFC